MTQNYHFTSDWFTPWIPNFQKNLIKTQDRQFNILEVGSYEGRSCVWFVDNLLENPASTITCVDPHTSENKQIQATFKANVSKSKYPAKVTYHNDFSNNILPRLILEKQQYDLIYIDGSHLAVNVLFDAINSWAMLKKNGVLWFDDYLGGENEKSRTDTPWSLPYVAVKSFISCLDPTSYEVVLDSYQFALRKL